LAHPQRLRLLQMLRQGRFTVGELAAGCGIPSHSASDHLRLLQRCGFLQAERNGRRVFYAIVDPLVHDILAGIECRFGKEQAK
jgi:DNA-binding transcriptional ArsR family regulator